MRTDAIHQKRNQDEQDATDQLLHPSLCTC